MSEENKKDAIPEEVHELLKIHANIADEYQMIFNLIIQLSILIDSFYENCYDEMATVDCIGYTINELYNHSLKEQELIRQTAEIRNKIFFDNTETKK